MECVKIICQQCIGHTNHNKRLYQDANFVKDIVHFSNFKFGVPFAFFEINMAFPPIPTSLKPVAHFMKAATEHGNYQYFPILLKMTSLFFNS